MPAKVTVGKIHFGRSKFDTLYKGEKNRGKWFYLKIKKPVHNKDEKQLNISYNLYYYFSIFRHKSKTGNFYRRPEWEV